MTNRLYRSRKDRLIGADQGFLGAKAAGERGRRRKQAEQTKDGFHDVLLAGQTGTHLSDSPWCRQGGFSTCRNARPSGGAR